MALPAVEPLLDFDEVSLRESLRIILQGRQLRLLN